MRILHVISSLDPEGGGPSQVVRMLVELAPAGTTSAVVTVDDPRAAFLASFPCPVYALGPAKSALKFSSRLWPWLRQHRSEFDGVLVHGLWNYITIAALRTLRGHTPYIVFVHGMLDPYFKRAFPLKHARNWVYWLANDYHLLRHAHRVLFTTETERELAEQSFSFWRWKPLVVPLGALEQPPPSPSDRAAFHELCPDRGDGRFLLFLGRIHAKKGCDLLIEAFARVQALDPELHLVIAGPDQGGLQPKLAALAAQSGIAHRVHWTGMLTGGTKEAAIAAADAFILPSHQENFGIAVVEALAAGRPVLLSDKVNIACDIAADGAGLVGPDTLEGTVAVLTDWLNLDAAARQQMAQQARNTFLTRYDMRQNVDAILQAFNLDA